MQVLLVKDIEHVGDKGETKRVAEGYARNYLFPRNLAVPVTEGSLANLKLLQAAWKRSELKEKEAFLLAAKEVEGKTIKVTRKSGEKGRLFGSVTSTELAELIEKECKVTIDKRIIQTDHIKETGEHDVVIRFSGEVKATLKLVVLPEEAPATA